MGIFVTAIYLVFSVISCEKNQYDSISSLIVGRWEWIKTVSPWTRYISDPKTAGYTQTLEISGHGIMREYKDDVLKHETKYQIESRTGNYYLLEKDTGIRVNFYLTGDTLEFNQAYVDGPVTYYGRSK